jgi:hypothetical protein
VVFLGKICGFTVQDNGAGFHEESFRAFNTSDTTRKVADGGRGLGRFLWLKAFEEVAVSSTYHDMSTWYLREFCFAMVPEGVVDDTLNEATGPGFATTVALRRMKEPYVDSVPQTAKAIARRLLEHCLILFVLDTAPTVIVVDAQAGLQIDVKDLYREEVLKGAETTTIGTGVNALQMIHLFVSSGRAASSIKCERRPVVLIVDSDRCPASG